MQTTLGRISIPQVLTRDPREIYEDFVLEMSSDGVISTCAITTRHDEGTPENVARGVTKRYSLVSARYGAVAIDADALNADLREDGELRGLLERVHSGHAIGWNELRSDAEGSLTPDAEEAHEYLCDMLDAEAHQRYVRDEIDVWDAESYCGDDARERVTVDTTDNELRAMATEFQAAAAEEKRIIVVGDIMRCLECVRDEKRAEAEDG